MKNWSHVEEWYILGKMQSECPTDCKRRPWSDQVVHIRQSWRHFSGSESCLTAVQKECATPLHTQRPPTSLHVTSFTKPALVLQVTNAGAKRPTQNSMPHYSRVVVAVSSSMGRHFVSSHGSMCVIPTVYRLARMVASFLGERKTAWERC